MDVHGCAIRLTQRMRSPSRSDLCLRERPGRASQPFRTVSSRRWSAINDPARTSEVDLIGNLSWSDSALVKIPWPHSQTDQGRPCQSAESSEPLWPLGVPHEKWTRG